MMGDELRMDLWSLRCQLTVQVETSRRQPDVHTFGPNSWCRSHHQYLLCVVTWKLMGLASNSDRGSLSNSDTWRCTEELTRMSPGRWRPVPSAPSHITGDISPYNCSWSFNSRKETFMINFTYLITEVFKLEYCFACDSLLFFIL